MHLFEFISLFVQVKYKEAYEMTKAKCYSLHPEGVNFVNSRKAHKICNEVRSVGRGWVQVEGQSDFFLVFFH